MVASTQTETVEDDDDNWGEEDKNGACSSADQKRNLLFTGAKGSSIDKELYTEKNVTEAIAKIKNANSAEEKFGKDSGDDWGSTDSLDDGDDEAWD